MGKPRAINHSVPARESQTPAFLGVLPSANPGHELVAHPDNRHGLAPRLRLAPHRVNTLSDRLASGDGPPERPTQLATERQGRRLNLARGSHTLSLAPPGAHRAILPAVRTIRPTRNAILHPRAARRAPRLVGRLDMRQVNGAGVAASQDPASKCPASGTRQLLAGGMLYE